MKLIYIVATLPYSAGNEDFFIPEIKELIRQKHEVLLVPRSPKGMLICEDAKDLLDLTIGKPLFSYTIIREAFYEISRSPGSGLRSLGLLFRSRSLGTLIKNLAIFPKGLWLARLARNWGADHIHAQWAAATASMALIASEASGIPWSITAHRGDIVQNNLLNVKAQKASFLRFISKSSLQLARYVGVRGLEKKARVIHMGISLPFFQVDPVKLSTASTILCPGNLIPVKGHKYLLESMAILRERNVECFLQIAGQGKLLQTLLRHAADLAITDRVTFLGQVPHSDLLKLYSDGKVGMVVLPSLDLGKGLHEGIPVSLIEAMSYGIPVLSTTTGGIPELLYGDAGLMVPPQDSVALANAIEQLIRDPVLRMRLSQAGKRRIMEEFAIESVVNDLLKPIKAN